MTYIFYFTVLWGCYFWPDLDEQSFSSSSKSDEKSSSNDHNSRHCLYCCAHGNTENRSRHPQTVSSFC